MENKKTIKKLNAIFWTTITFSPFIIILIGLITGIFNVNKANTDMTNYLSNILTYSLNSIEVLENLTIPTIQNAFEDITTTLSINSNAIATILTFMLCIQIYHLIFDVLFTIIQLAHKVLDKIDF